MLQINVLRHPRLQRRLRDKRQRRGRDRAPITAKHRSHMNRLGRRDTGVGIPHLNPGDRPRLNHNLWFHPKKRRLSETEIRQLTHLHRPHLVHNPMGNCRINRVLRHIPLRPQIIIAV